MKSYSLFAVILALMFSSCGKSDEEIKKLGAVQSEVSQLQQQLSSKWSELNKTAWEIDAIAHRQDKIAKAKAGDVQSAKEMIMVAFKATEGKGWQIPPRDDFNGIIKALEVDKGILKNAVDEATNAINKSRNVIDAVNKK